MAQNNKKDDQSGRSWGEKAREWLYGKKGEEVKSAEDAAKKILNKKKGKGKLRHTKY